jgi:glycosyltransferase involved in cell wall biosynthesis
MRVLFNAANLFKGGALQVATSFVLQALEDVSMVRWRFALSARVAEEVSRFVKLPSTIEIFERSPARDNAGRKRLAALADKHPEDPVFTLLGPAYVRFRSPHLLGFADGWVSHSTWTAYRTLNFPSEWFSFAATSLYKAFWLRRADHWCVETEVARQGLHRRIRLPLDRISVVPNTCGDHYRQATFQSIPVSGGEKLRILALAAPYPHKNLTLLPPVAVELQRLEPELDFEVVFTLPGDAPLWGQVVRDAQRLGVEKRVVNHGPFAVSDGPALYRSCHVCLLPTLLETYSATYAESMAMGLPIVTTDLSFAHSACRDAALYFQPRNVAAAAKQIQRLVPDPALRQQLVSRGQQIFAELPTPRQRYEMYVEVLKRLPASSASS